MELSQLASQMETYYKNEIVTLQEKAEKLEKDKAQAVAELGKLRTKLLKDMIPSTRTNNKESSKPVPRGQHEKWSQLGSSEIEKHLLECTRSMQHWFDVPKVEKFHDDKSTSVWTPKSIPRENLETVWLYPDGKILPDSAGFDHLQAKTQECDDLAKDVSST